MKHLLSLLFFGSCLCIQAQEVGNEARENRWKIGIAASPEIAYKRIVINDARYASGSEEDRSRCRFAHTSGIFVNYFFSDVFGIGSGAAWSVKGYRVPRYELVWNHRPGPPDPALPAYWTHTFARHFVDIPLTAILKLGKGRWRSISQAGAALNVPFAVRSTNTEEFEDGRIHRYEWSSFENDGNGYLSGLISTGVSYDVSQRVEVRMEPVLRYMVWNSRMHKDPSYMHYWNAGVSIGAFMTL